MASAAYPGNSLKTRITLSTLTIFLAGLWSLSFFASHLLRKDVEQLLSGQQLSIVSMVAAEVDHELEDRLKALEKAAGSSAQAMRDGPPAMQALIEQGLILQSLFNAGVIAYGADGTVIADSVLPAGRLGVNYMDVATVATALKEGKSTIGRPLIGKKLKAPVIGMVVPIRDAQGKVIGALAGVTNLGMPNFLDNVAENRYGQTGGYLLIAPQYRLIVTASDKNRIMEVLPANGISPWIDRVIQGYQGTDIFVNPVGVEVLTSVKGIPAAGWIMVVALPTEEAFAPIRDMQRRMLLTTFFLTLLAGGLTWWLLRRQLAPMIAAANTLAVVSGQDQPLRALPITRQDEIGKLIGGFNHVLETLEKREAALRKSELRFRDLLQDVPSVAVQGYGPDGTTRYWNKASEQLYGYAAAEAIGCNLLDLIIPPEMHQGIREAMRQMFETGHPIPAGELSLMRKDGSRVEVFSSHAHVQVPGQAPEMFCVDIDLTERKRMEDAVRRNGDQYRAIIQASFDGFWITDNSGRILDANESICRILGYSREELLRLGIADIEADESPEETAAHIREMVATGHVRFEARHRRKDGVVINVEVSVLYVAAIGERFFAFVRDITERKRAEADLRIAATAFESHEGMFIADDRSVIVRVNRAFVEITGYTADEAIGQTPRLLSSGRHDAAFYQAMQDSIACSGVWQGEIWNRRKNGEVYPQWLTITAVKNAQGDVTHYVSTLTDITQRKTAEDEIRNLAFYDPLTRLPNRRLLLDRLKQALASSTRSGRYGALLFIDLDNFKTLNDTLGHDIGDLLLQQVGQRLATCVREGDTVARLGGDEFVVMLEDLSETLQEAATQAETVGEKILVTLNRLYQLDSYEHHSTPSIGVTLFADHQETVDELLKRADLAMYQAKAAGRNTLCFFDPEMQAVVAKRAALEAALREAILKRQFLLYYQAQVDGEGRLTGAEALVRWQHPEYGLVSPAMFIPLAEDTGLILPLGHWVLETACFELASWATRPEMADLTIAVNVSARQFHHPDFVDQVLAVLDHTGANPQKLKLELTESLLVDDVEDVIAKMSELKARGVGFSLDDFGTGYSSLSYLKRLPLDQLKIDQGFVRDILTDPNDAAIAKMVIALAESLGLAVIAEGVEIEAQKDFLAHHGCHAYQGYLFSRPLPLEEFEKLVPRA